MRLAAINRRTGALRDSVREFDRLRDAHAGELRVELVSAVALTERQIADFERTAAERCGVAAVKLAARVDPALLGGAVVSVGVAHDRRDDRDPA